MLNNYYKIFYEKSKFKILLAFPYVLACAALQILNAVKGKEAKCIADTLAYTFWGCAKYVRGMDFKMPLIWIAFWAFLLVLLSDFMLGTMAEDMQIMLRRGRIRWYLAKITSALMIAAAYILLYYLIIIGYCMVNKLPLYLKGKSVFYMQSTEMYLSVFLAPLLTALAFVMLEQVLALYTSSFISLIASVASLVISTFFQNRFIIGNYAMVCRCRALDKKNGISSVNGVWLLTAYIAALFICGLIRVRRRNMLSSRIE